MKSPNSSQTNSLMRAPLLCCAAGGVRGSGSPASRAKHGVLRGGPLGLVRFHVATDGCLRYRVSSLVSKRNSQFQMILSDLLPLGGNDGVMIFFCFKVLVHLPHHLSNWPLRSGALPNVRVSLSQRPQEILLVPNPLLRFHVLDCSPSV